MEKVQGGPNGRAFGRVHSGAAPRRASGFRHARRIRFNDGFGRNDRDG